MAISKQELIEALKDLIGEKTGTKTTAKAPEFDETTAEGKAEKKAYEARMAKIKEKELAGQAEMNKMLSETASILGNINDAYKFRAESLKAELEQNQELMQFLKEQGATLETLRASDLEALSDAFKSEKEKLELIAEENEMLEARNKYQKANKRLFDDITGAIGMNINMQNTFMGKMLAVGKQLRMDGEEGEKARKQFTRDLAEAFHPAKLLYSVMAKIVEASIKVAMEFDKARAALAASTGAGYKFAGGLFDAQRSARLFGVSMDDAKNATAGLVEGTSNFAKMNKDSRAELTQTTAMMGRLGIDTAMAAETFQFMNVVLGKSAEQSQDFQKELAMMGTSIGIPAKKMTKDFNAALPMLAVYGDRAVKVFSNLAAAAKAAGVETSTLLGIAKQYDTFAGAAEGSAKLNALLGTQLSTTQMLMMTEDERIETLIESVQAQGIAFKDMDRFTQKAIMAAAGITDLNEANKIFGMSVSAYRENQREMTRNAEVQKKFEDAVAATVPVMEKFKLLAGEFIVSIQPFLNTLGEIAEKVTAILNGMTDEQKQSISNTIMLVGALGGLVVSAKSIMFIFGPVAAVVAKLGTGLFGIASAAAPASAGLGAIAPSAAAAAGGLLPLVKVFGLLALVIGGVTLAFAGYQAAKSLSLEQEAKIADASAREAEAYERSASSLIKLSEIDFASVSVKVRQLVQDIASIGGAGDIMVRTRSTIENLALISTGQAKDSMTGNIVQASAANVTANVNNVFSGMKMVLDVGGKQIEGVIRDIAQQEVNT